MISLFTWVACSRGEGSIALPQVLRTVSINAFFFFAYAYLATYWLIPRILFKKRYTLFAILIIASGLIISWFKLTVSDFLFYDAIANESYSGGKGFTFPDIIVNTKDMTFIVAVFALLKFSRDNYLIKSRSAKSEEQRLEAELKILGYQLDPHIIFNNFNNLYSISITRPELLSSTIKKFKLVLEYLFVEKKDAKVSLKKELNMIENYIGLELLRFGERLQVNYEISGNPESLKIAPLLLYPFVENCFEHGPGMDTDASWIDIKIEIIQSRLRLRVANSTPHNIYLSDGSQKGGLENIVSRLEILYPDEYRLTISENPGSYNVNLQLNLI
ncbi:MAG: histidine kinase [Bacteroidales bacterium]|nr:histidine kinase [Bacteroidales bacterium]